MQLIILRHGRTQANEDDLYVGAHLDMPLSAHGRKDARACGCSEDVKMVYVSPSLRARETARICFPAARQHVIEALHEMDFGAFEGRSPDSMADDADYRAWVDGWCSGKCPGGEDRATFTQRVHDAVYQLLIEAKAHARERVIIVAHSGTVFATMSSLCIHAKSGNDCADEGRAYFSWLVGNAEGYYAEVVFDEAKNPSLESPVHFTDLGFMGK